MAEAKYPSPRTASEAKPALRTDLTLVYDNPETGSTGLRIVDPKSGRQYSFSGDEEHLCRLADGDTDIAGLHAKLDAAGGSLSVSDVKRFFRRLRVLGLLQPPACDDEAPRAPETVGLAQENSNLDRGVRRDPRELLRRRREELGSPKVEKEPSQTARDLGDTDARRALLLRRSRGAASGEDERSPEGGEERSSAPADRSSGKRGRVLSGGKTVTEAVEQGQEVRTGAAARDVPAEPSGEGEEGGTPSAQPAGGSGVQDDSRSRTKADKEENPETAPGRPDQGGKASRSDNNELHGNPEEKGQSETAAKRESTPKTKKSFAKKQRPRKPITYVKRDTRSASDAPDSMIRRLRDRPSRGIAPRTGVPSESAYRKERAMRRRSAGQQASALPAEADAKRSEHASNLVARRLSERARQAEASMAATAAPPAPDDLGGAHTSDFDQMHGGNEAGGLGGGFGRGMRQGMMGGPRAGMMGQGPRAAMMGQGFRGRAAQQAQQPKKKMPARLPLFDPQGLFRVLYILGYPFKYVLWIIAPLAVLAVFTLLNNAGAVRADVTAAAADLSSAAALILGLFVVNLVSRVAQGVAIVAHGGRVEMLGFGLVMGVIPRFVIDRSGIGQLDRSGQLWAYGSVLLARLGIFCAGTLIWAITREQGGQLALLSLLASQTALTIFLITMFPLVPSEGQRWMAVMLNEPRLMPKMLMSLKHVFRGSALPPSLSKKDAMPLALFAIATILTSLAILGVIMGAALIWLEQELDGLGVLIFLAGLASFLLWFRAMFRQKRKQGGNFDLAAFREMAPEGATPLAASSAGAATASEEQAGLSGRAKVVWALILAALVAVAFLPYDYYAGGQVEILPAARGQAVARTDGEIVEILVREGSEVEAGEVVARLSSWDQESDVAVNEARLEGAKANLSRLKAGAKPEEIELARRQLEKAEKDVTFFEAEAERARELVKSGTVSTATLEKAESDLANRLADLEVAKANLELVESPPTDEEIAVAQSEVDRLERELAFARGELERTRIVAPVDGRVVTGNLQLRLGSYLRSGDVLLEIEQSEKVQAEIHVPESDIGLISLGDTVRLKTWGNSDEEILGTVEAISPVAEDQAYGSVVRVGASFDNEQDVLRSGMTGYAKIYGGEMRVWEAYLRSIRRFVQVEVWSWVP